MITSQLEYEDLVLNIVKDYLNKNVVFDIQKMVPYILNQCAKSNINLNNSGIRKILISLLEKKHLVKGTALTKQDLFLNLNRKQIYEYINQNPGTYINKISTALKINNRVIIWHITFLLKFDLIKAHKLKIHEIYYNPGKNLDDAKKNFYLSKEKSQKIIYYLNTNKEGLTKNQISEALQMHPNTVTKYLDLLEGFSVILSEKIENTTLYFLKESK